MASICRLFLVGQELLGQGFQPLGRDVGGDAVIDRFQALEDVAEHAVELVEVLLVLHQAGAGQEVEVLDRAVDDVLVQGLHEHQVLAQADRDLGLAELGEEAKEHRRGFRTDVRSVEGS
jgi:hypothetical protein